MWAVREGGAHVEATWHEREGQGCLQVAFRRAHSPGSPQPRGPTTLHHTQPRRSLAPPEGEKLKDWGDDRELVQHNHCAAPPPARPEVPGQRGAGQPVSRCGQAAGDLPGVWQNRPSRNSRPAASPLQPGARI
ncbi:hypothetical protein E2C01_068899 [Portunus trituberculatus]|uniref:Uncharacterized protein n=1 Tax=Portunus trituberculatus TaxID=210409 RepID=A0A5B7HXY8_PORTR|nr:hypothetical protein [Portunus trituberculatus]